MSARIGDDRTIATYERIAREYAAEITDEPPPERADALARLLDALFPCPAILEVGSGTGRDADHLERLGARVRRTDAASAFVELQAERGRHAQLLDVIADDLGGPYDAVLAMCVLIHVERARTDALLRKVARALRPSGAFLVSVREGIGEERGACHMTYWCAAEFETRLAVAGFNVGWQSRHTDSADETWLTFLAHLSPEGA
jgi:2-polyprenyl-3-methyl-5-hydroxy-6-metoxy-1,4-benzoquinol methylase